MGTTDDEIYSRIGKVLYEAAPENAIKIFLDAELSPENDHAKFLFDYVDNLGEKKWFVPNSPDVDGKLIETLVELRKYYIENNLTNGLPAWSGCEITVDLDKMKINIDFKY
ncbi:hypothetical protein ABR965_22765, partial [Photorhabdus laumondii]